MLNASKQKLHTLWIQQVFGSVSTGWFPLGVTISTTPSFETEIELSGVGGASVAFTPMGGAPTTRRRSGNILPQILHFPPVAHLIAHFLQNKG